MLHESDHQSESEMSPLKKRLAIFGIGAAALYIAVGAPILDHVTNDTPPRQDIEIAKQK